MQIQILQYWQKVCPLLPLVVHDQLRNPFPQTRHPMTSQIPPNQKIYPKVNFSKVLYTFILQSKIKGWNKEEQRGAESRNVLKNLAVAECLTCSWLIKNVFPWCQIPAEWWWWYQPPTRKKKPHPTMTTINANGRLALYTGPGIRILHAPMLLFGSGTVTKKMYSTLYQCCGSRSAWIRNFCLDPELLFRIRNQQKITEQINKKIYFSFSACAF